MPVTDLLGPRPAVRRLLPPRPRFPPRPLPFPPLGLLGATSSGTWTANPHPPSESYTVSWRVDDWACRSESATACSADSMQACKDASPWIVLPTIGISSPGLKALIQSLSSQAYSASSASPAIFCLLSYFQGSPQSGKLIWGLVPVRHDIKTISYKAELLGSNIVPLWLPWWDSYFRRLSTLTSFKKINACHADCLDTCCPELKTTGLVHQNSCRFTSLWTHCIRS